MGKDESENLGAVVVEHSRAGFTEKSMRDPTQPKQMEAVRLGTLRRPREKEMLSGLLRYIDSLADDQPEYVKNFLQRRRAATDRQSSSPAPRMP